MDCDGVLKKRRNVVRGRIQESEVKACLRFTNGCNINAAVMEFWKYNPIMWLQMNWPINLMQQNKSMHLYIKHRSHHIKKSKSHHLPGSR